MVGTGSAPTDRDAALRAQQRRRSFDHVGPDAPADPVDGATWYDTDARGGDGEPKVYDGTEWFGTVFVVVGAAPGQRGRGAAGGGA